MSQKGDRRERELVNILDKNGFAVLRAPASGGSTKRHLPDILAGNAKDFYAIEAKSRSSNRLYISGRQIEGLLFFAINFGAKPRIGVRFDEEKWYFTHPNNTYITDSNNYRIDKDVIFMQGESIDELA